MSYDAANTLSWGITIAGIAVAFGMLFGLRSISDAIETAVYEVVAAWKDGEE